MPLTATSDNPDLLRHLRHDLVANGYRYVPVQGKRPAGSGWQNFSQVPGEIDGFIEQYPHHINTGILTGDVVATKMKLVGSGESATYGKSAVKRFRRPVETVYMESTPNAEETLDMAMKGK